MLLLGFAHHFQKRIPPDYVVSRMDEMNVVLERLDCEAVCSEATLGRAFGRRDFVGPPLERLKAGCVAWLEEVENAEVAAILFRIGPSALGQERASAIEDRHGIARIRALLEEVAVEDGIKIGNTELVATFINSLVAQAVLYRLKSGSEVGPDLAKAIDALTDRFAGGR